MRITPACAGNKINYSWIKYRSQDHPRVCEEQAIYVCRWVRDEGSPPRVRGTETCPPRPGRPSQIAQNIRISCPARITPACAGNRPGLPARAADPGDHPRVCGEQAGAEGAEERFGGSPPRVRGTEMHGMYQRFHIGITPACAGNRNSFLRIPGNNKDHPRVCGEQALAMRKILCSIGSPPRVRGTGTPLRAEDHRDGITPACAGNSPPRSPA